MKQFLYILLLLLVSCTSNTIYEKPKDLIPKDTMVYLLTDLFIASSAKNEKNTFLEKRVNYLPLVYQKIKIDTVRFLRSNVYYTSKIEIYDEILKEVKIKTELIQKKYEEELRIADSITKEKRKEFIDELDTVRVRIPEEKLKKFKKMKNQRK